MVEGQDRGSAILLQALACVAGSGRDVSDLGEAKRVLRAARDRHPPPGDPVAPPEDVPSATIVAFPCGQ